MIWMCSLEFRTDLQEKCSYKYIFEHWQRAPSQNFLSVTNVLWFVWVPQTKKNPPCLSLGKMQVQPLSRHNIQIDLCHACWKVHDSIMAPIVTTSGRRASYLSCSKYSPAQSHLVFLAAVDITVEVITVDETWHPWTLQGRIFTGLMQLMAILRSESLQIFWRN